MLSAGMMLLLLAASQQILAQEGGDSIRRPGFTAWDVGVTKVADQTQPGVNQPVKFTITVTNHSGEGVTGVVVKDLLPAGLLYTSHTAQQGTYVPATGIWNVGAMASDQSLTLTVNVKLIIATEVCNGVTVENYDHFGDDANPDNNSDEVCIDSPDILLDLGVTKTVYNGAPKVGEHSVFTIQVTNYSNTHAAHNVVIEDVLHNNFVFFSSSASTGSYNPGTNLWTIPVIQPQSQVQLEITVKVNGSGDNMARLISLDETDTASKNNQDLVSVTVSGSSGGNDGGLESNGSLAALIANRNYDRARESRLGAMVSREQVPAFSEILASQQIIAPAGRMKGGINLAELLSEKGPFGSTGFITTPDDLIGISNATQVFSVDYFNQNDRRMAAILAIATEDEVYNHTKLICDRLMGATLDLIHKPVIRDEEFILGKLVQPDGSVDYAISMVVYAANGAWVIDNRWHNEEYQILDGSEVFNFQVWSVTPQSTIDMVNELLNRLESHLPLSFNNRETAKTPAVFVKSGYYADGMLHLNLHNTPGNGKVTVRSKLTRHEGADRERFEITLDIDPQQINQSVSVPTGYLFDIDFSLANESDPARDALYYADGPWGKNYDPQGARINHFSVESCQGSLSGDALNLERNASLSGQVRTYASIFRALKPGNVPVDLTGYGQIQFEAMGSGQVEMVISKASIKRWSDQFRTRISLGTDWKTYTIDLTQLSSVNHRFFTPEDLLNVVFSAIGNGSDWRDFDIRIRNLSFKKGTSNLEPHSGNSLNISNFPNPFRDFTTLKFSLSSEASVEIQVYNIQGQEVKWITNRLFQSGVNQVDLDLSELDPGIYVVRLTSNQFVHTHRLNLMK